MRADADKLLEVEPLSVMMKKRPSPSGDDLVPYWDMKAPGMETKSNSDIPRDASAAAILASGLYELATYVDAGRALRYINAADKILDSLTASYSIKCGESEGFILDHSTGHHPADSEVDVPLVYADYYYLEALLRKRNR